MTKHAGARLTTAVAVGLLLAAAMLQVGYAGSVTAHVTDDWRPVVAAIWLASAITLVLIAGVVLAVRALDGPRIKLVLAIVALIPLSMGALQIVYGASWPPAETLLLAAAALLLTAWLDGGTATQRPAV
jgi:hypothetical protein